MIDFTREQAAAVAHKGASLLVSAAAGSGKTAVLVERIISKILSEEESASILDFLIVTFTKAAATEMREKITETLYARLAKEPENIRIQRELAVIGEAKIDTIDGFYYKTIKKYAEKLQLSPNLRIGNESEILLLIDAVIEELMDEFYEGGRVDFLDAIDFFSRARDDLGFVTTVKNVISALETYPEPEQFLYQQVQAYDNEGNFENYGFIQEIKKAAKEKVLFAKENLSKAIEEAGEEEVLLKAYVPAFQEHQQFFEKLLIAVDGDWDTAYALLREAPNPRLGTARGVDKEVTAWLKEMRDEAKEIGNELGKSYIFLSKAEVLDDIQKMRPHLMVLADFVKAYYSRLAEEKKKHGFYDFSDLSRFMYRLLIHDYDANTKNFARTQEAKDIAAEFTEIFVDEYQDTNALQDLIFEAISKDGQNLFMVGDAKQSIYRFRQAEPEIFTRKKNAYVEQVLYKETGIQKNGVKLSLNKNFRSRSNIIDFVNFVFGLSFSIDTAEMAYEGEALVFGAEDYERERNLPIEVNLIVPNEEKEEEGEDQFSEEADFVCEKIKSILENEQVFDRKEKSYRKAARRDIVVLMRSLKGASGALTQRLMEQGIPAFCDTAEVFFQREEVSLLLSLLKVIDNPLQDIPLVAVMLSPVFVFTPEELTEIVLTEEGKSFYEKLLNGKNRSEKQNSFTDKISRYRAKSKHLSVEELLLYMIEDLQYNPVISGLTLGEIRVLNVRLLLDYAAEFEKSSFRGLYSFNQYIQKTIDSGRDLPSAKIVSENSNVVRIMTIHKSKGLEFPFVILCDMAKRFNTQKYSESVLVHKNLGIGAKLRNTQSMSEYNTAQRGAMILKMKREALAEELRCLYVALTRAKEGLYIFINTRGKQNTVRKMSTAIAQGGCPHPVQLSGANSLAKILLYCLQFAKNGEAINAYYGVRKNGLFEVDFQVHILQAMPKTEGIERPEEAGEIRSEEPESKTEEPFIYPFAQATITPTKTSVTALKNKESIKLFDKPAFKRPQFLTEKTKMTAAERGTAMHRAVECANFTLLKEDPKKELNRLVENGFLSEKQGKACDADKLLRFTQCPLFHRMESAKEFEKELVFNCFYEQDGEKQLLQGIIDAVFCDEAGRVIVDFKTDRLKDEAIFVEKYNKQLEIYKDAYEKMTRKKVDACFVYSFEMGKAIKIL